MADIRHRLSINAPRGAVFEAISRPAGLDAWWTLQAAGTPIVGAIYELGFGPGYDWRGVVSRCVPDTAFELEITTADSDWTGTHVGFHLQQDGPVTQVLFHHAGWERPNMHFLTSNYCWAMYLRRLKRYVEHREIVPYDARLD